MCSLLDSEERSKFDKLYQKVDEIKIARNRKVARLERRVKYDENFEDGFNYLETLYCPITVL